MEVCLHPKTRSSSYYMMPRFQFTDCRLRNHDVGVVESPCGTQAVPVHCVPESPIGDSSFKLMVTVTVLRPSGGLKGRAGEPRQIISPKVQLTRKGIGRNPIPTRHKQCATIACRPHRVRIKGYSSSNGLARRFCRISVQRSHTIKRCCHFSLPRSHVNHCK